MCYYTCLKCFYTRLHFYTLPLFATSHFDGPTLETRKFKTRRLSEPPSRVKQTAETVIRKEHRLLDWQVVETAGTSQVNKYIQKISIVIVCFPASRLLWFSGMLGCRWIVSCLGSTLQSKEKTQTQSQTVQKQYSIVHIVPSSLVLKLRPKVPLDNFCCAWQRPCATLTFRMRIHTPAYASYIQQPLTSHQQTVHLHLSTQQINHQNLLVCRISQHYFPTIRI